MIISKQQWEYEISKKYNILFNKNVFEQYNKAWWCSSKTFRLSAHGFNIFKMVNIIFYEFEFPPIIKWSGNKIIQISNMPCPHFFVPYKSNKLYFTDKKYEILIKLADIDLDSLLGEFNEKI
jgi:hypothetical protein